LRRRSSRIKNSTKTLRNLREYEMGFLILTIINEDEAKYERDRREKNGDF